MYYIAENLELRRDENAQLLHKMTNRNYENCLEEVDLSIERLFYWAAYCDKYGGTVQVRLVFRYSIKLGLSLTVFEKLYFAVIVIFSYSNS